MIQQKIIIAKNLDTNFTYHTEKSTFEISIFYLEISFQDLEFQNLEITLPLKQNSVGCFKYFLFNFRM